MWTELPSNILHPDRWVVIEYEGQLKILSGWYGSYLNSPSWRLSSNITEVSNVEAGYEVLTASGSKYFLHIANEGFNLTSGAIYEELRNKHNVTRAYINE